MYRAFFSRFTPFVLFLMMVSSLAAPFALAKNNSKNFRNREACLINALIGNEIEKDAEGKSPELESEFPKGLIESTKDVRKIELDDASGWQKLDLPLNPLLRHDFGTLKHPHVWDVLTKEGKRKLTYFEDVHGRIFLSDSQVEIAPDKPIIVSDSYSGKDSLSVVPKEATKKLTIIPKEAGTLTVDEHTKEWVFEPKYNLGATKEEHLALMKDLEANLPPGTKLKEHDEELPGMKKEEIYSCAEKAKLADNWKIFLGTSVATAMIVQVGSMAHDKLFKTKEGVKAGTARGIWTGSLEVQDKGVDIFLSKIENWKFFVPAVGAKWLISWIDSKPNNHFTNFVLHTHMKHFVLYTDGEEDKHLTNAQFAKKTILNDWGKPTDPIASETAKAELKVDWIEAPEALLLDKLLLSNLGSLTLNLCQLHPGLNWVFNGLTVRVVEKVGTEIAGSWYINKKVEPLIKAKENDKEKNKEQEKK